MESRTEDHPYRSAPHYIQFYPTLRCDLSCSFCFNRGVPSQADVTVGDFRRIVSLLSGAGVRRIDILGGEPALHPRFSELVEVVSEGGLATTISTNGRRDVRLLENIHRRHGDGQVKVGVSLHSDEVSAELDRYIRACRPFLKSVYQKAGGIRRSAENYLPLPGIEHFLLFMDAVVPADLENCMPFPEFFGDLARLRKVHPGLGGVFCSGFIPDRISFPELQYARCPAGTTKLSMLPDGSLYPCYLLFRHDEFRLGNILTDDFGKIWGSGKLEFFRTYHGNRCPMKECRLFSRCHGGCPAVSLLAGGGLSAPDPRCVRPGM